MCIVFYFHDKIGERFDKQCSNQVLEWPMPENDIRHEENQESSNFAEHEHENRNLKRPHHQGLKMTIAHRKKQKVNNLLEHEQRFKNAT